MTEQQRDLEKRLFAAALYRIRLLLASHVGSDAHSPEAAAAALAYLLHNDALAALSNQPVDIPGVLSKLDRLSRSWAWQFLQNFGGACSMRPNNSLKPKPLRGSASFRR
ncbi:MAG: hypothetical protein EON50_18905 [Acidovorax sp.]|nr:MAG: hypothetical protein EON50_18905 [Acidovorax sp.]